MYDEQYRDEVMNVVPKKWANVERQRPRLRFAKWGLVAGGALSVLGLLGVGSLVFGLIVLVAAGVWTFSLLR